MPRYSGMIGYATSQEGNPGVHLDVITERKHIGEVLTDSRQNQNGNQVNDNVVINNRFSIMADGFADSNLANMKYINWMGTSWKIASVQVQRPRLILTIGGVYNGPKPIIEPSDGTPNTP